MYSFLLLAAQADDSSGAVVAAWIAAVAAIAAAIIGGISSYLIHQSNKQFVAAESDKARKHTKTHDTMLKQLDRFFEVRDSELEHARSQVSSLAHYAPLVASAISSVKFRLQEIVSTSGEIGYFHSDKPTSDFIEYKRISTLYRVATLFAWLRAFKLEQSLLNPIEVEDLRPQIEAVERAFGDGHFVDERRVELLVGQEVDDSETKAVLSRKLSALLQEFLAKHPAIPRHQLDLLDPNEKDNLCRRAVEMVNEHLMAGLAVPQEIERDNMLRRIGIREAWLYRDWQDALGGMMLVETENSERRYNVIGYEEFEEIYHQSLGMPPEGEVVAEKALTPREMTFKRWLPRLKCVFDQLDMSNRADARVIQLKGAFEAIEGLASAIDAVIDGFNKRAELTEEK